MRLRSVMFVVLVVLCVCGITASADIAIPGTIHYPSVPLELPVFQTSVDDAIGNRINARTTAPHTLHTKDNGEASMFSAGAAVVPAVSPDVEIDRGVAKAFFNAVLPKDETVRKLGPRFVRALQRFHDNGIQDPVEITSSILRMERFIALNGSEYRVYGEGSAAVAEVAGESVRASVIRWKRVTGRNLVPSISLNDAALEQALNERFPPVEGYDVEVTDSPELAYYDDETTISPVYRVAVNINRHDGGHSDELEVFIRAVAIASAPPVVIAGDDVGLCAQPGAQHQDATEISVDRYAVRGDGDQWLTNAQLFRAGLAAPFVARRFCALEPAMLGANAGYIDGANVALIEAHGERGCVLLQPCVRLSDAQGYGNQTDGLQLLVLHSCRIVATSDDDKLKWSNRWWTIFKGLHTVLGYRKTMSISDGVSVNYAKRLANDEPMVSSWLMEAAASSSYTQVSPNGRPAAVTVCGHDNDRPSQLTKLSNPDCLVAYWLRN